ncbi:hypothetical protein HOD20_02530 [archaeon]|nr:hypothetical protein [archaeon]
MNMVQGKVKKEGTIDSKLYNTEKILSSLLLEINELKSKSKEYFLDDYGKKIEKLERMITHLHTSRENYIRKYEKYYTISKKLALLLKKNDQLSLEKLKEDNNNLKKNILLKEKENKFLISENIKLKNKNETDKVISKLTEELKHYYEKSKKYEKKYDYYFTASKNLSLKLKSIEKQIKNDTFRKELLETRKKLDYVIKHTENKKRIEIKEFVSKFEEEVLRDKKKLEYYKVLSESNDRKYNKYLVAAKRFSKELKYKEQENIKLKKIVKNINKYISEQSLYYKEKIEKEKSRRKNSIEKVTKDHLQKELELNSRIVTLKKDIEKYYNLYNKAVIEKSEAFQKAKSFFEKNK